MDTKKITYILLALLLVTMFPLTAHAGRTTLSGTASCYMPEKFEMKLSPAARARLEAPTPSGASGQYTVQKTERRAPEPKTIPAPPQETMLTQTASNGPITVFTVCAK
jgi:hypothetical protein